MQAKNIGLTKIGSLLAALALITLGASAQAAPKAAVVKTATPQAVVIKLGPAMQEEYTAGEPAERTTTYLTGEMAQKPASSKTAPKPQG